MTPSSHPAYVHLLLVHDKIAGIFTRPRELHQSAEEYKKLRPYLTDDDLRYHSIETDRLLDPPVSLNVTISRPPVPFNS